VGCETLTAHRSSRKKTNCSVFVITNSLRLWNLELE
jgi:hypothetical protein